MKKYLAAFCFLLVFSCQNDVHDLEISGVITNSKNGEAIKGIRIKVICWKYGNTPDQSFTEDETKEAFTNAQGEYSIAFNKGAFIELLIDSTGFQKVHEAQYVSWKKTKIDLELTEKN